MGDEHWWVGTSSPTPDVAPVVEPPTQRNWSPPPQQRSTVSWPSLRQERIQRQSQASEQIILPEPPTEGPSPVRRTGHAQQQRQLPDNVYGSDPVGTEILTDAAWENLLQDPTSLLRTGAATLPWPG